MPEPITFNPFYPNPYLSQIPEGERDPVNLSGPLVPGENVIASTMLLTVRSCSGDRAQLRDRFPRGGMTYTYLAHRVSTGVEGGSIAWAIVGGTYEPVSEGFYTLRGGQ